MDGQKFNLPESDFDPYGQGAAPQENESGETEGFGFGSPRLERESLERPSFDSEPVRPEPEFTYPQGEIPKKEPFAVPKNENVPAGIAGAFLFSLVGGCAAFLLSRLGYVAAISGFITIFLAIFGYNLFSGLNKTKTQSKKAIITGLVMTVTALFIAEYCSMAFSILKELKADPETVGVGITYSDCFGNLFGMLSAEGRKTFGMDLLLQYIFAAVGCRSYMKQFKEALNKSDI